MSLLTKQRVPDPAEIEIKKMLSFNVNKDVLTILSLIDIPKLGFSPCCLFKCFRRNFMPRRVLCFLGPGNDPKLFYYKNSVFSVGY